MRSDENRMLMHHLSKDTLIDMLTDLRNNNAILRDALERIAYQQGSPNEHIDYLAGIAAEALSRAGGGDE